ncbi:MAG: hypothetical protein EXS03_09525 [Phycisphaerales bacterium]|nr:hypothetical protein [Phycisphaerales bacterium]
MKRMIPMWIAIVAGFAMLFSAFFPVTESLGEIFGDMFNVVAAIAFILGAGSLAKINLAKVSRRDPGWGYAAVTLACFALTLAAGLGKIGAAPNPKFAALAWSGDERAEGALFGWIYESALVPITSTMFALLAFYVASAAFRAFRAKNIDAILLLSTAFIVLLGRTFAGVVLTGWFPDWASGLRLENFSVYIMQVFNTAGNRAIIIGIALGVAATSLRILLGVDRSWMGTGGSK